MSYILYINGNKIDLTKSSPIAQTKQVNDLGRLDNRQTNFTNKFTVPPTPNNVRSFEKVGLVGNQSNLPYKKNVVDLFDADTGECLIYKGWGNITGTSEKGYDVYVYDGNIDFYKSIENLTLTDVGISDLNHIKNLTNVINSFGGTLNYMYIIADYNGNNKTSTNALNIDFQLPSARVSYIWERIFSYTGFTFSGSAFDSEKYKNLWITFPKPVPTLIPITNEVTSQNSEIRDTVRQEGGLEYVHFYYSVLFPSAFDNAYANNNNIYTTIKQDGVFRIKAVGSFTNNSGTSSFLNWTLKNSADVIKATGSFDASINTANVNALTGDKLYITSPVTGYTGGGINNPLTGSMFTSLDFILGYDANFDEALIDFKAKDFVNEIMQDFGLTMFKDKYTNNVDFKTLKEILQSETVIDWSDKFNNKGPEKYILSNYAKRNNFKYRYNDDNVNYNDGFFTVNNENLSDEITILTSKIYSPEKIKTTVIGLLLNTYKFWNKEIKDDSTVEYKELTGRYYFLRSKPHTFTEAIKIGSESLNTETTVSNIQIEDYSRLKYQEVIFDNYSEIESVLNKSKVLDVNFNLKTKDVASFTFKNLIYVEQLASYYLVNKIASFIKGKLTKCEIIEVDYLKTLDAPTEPSLGTFITITNIELSGCDLVIHFDTDADLPRSINVIGQPNSFGVIPSPVLDPEYYYNSVAFPTSKTISIKVLAGGFWEFILHLPNENIFSNHYFFDNRAICNYVPPTPELTFLKITHAQTLSINTLNNTRKIRIDFDSDLEFPNDIIFHGLNYIADGSVPEVVQTIHVTEKYFTVDLQYLGGYGPTEIWWFAYLQYKTITSEMKYIYINF